MIILTKAEIGLLRVLILSKNFAHDSGDLAVTFLTYQKCPQLTHNSSLWNHT